MYKVQYMQEFVAVNQSSHFVAFLADADTCNESEVMCEIEVTSLENLSHATAPVT